MVVCRRPFQGTVAWEIIVLSPRNRGEAMSLYGQSISADSLVMLRKVLGDECSGREIDINGVKGEDLTLLLTHAFRAGMTDTSELVILARNYVETYGEAGKIERHDEEATSGKANL